MRLLMLAIRYDVDDWATNFIPKWVAKIAEHVTHVDVLALEVGNMGELPANVQVYAMGKAPGVSRARVLARFYREAWRLVPRCDAVFVHMIPRYALLVAPLSIPLRKPITLWYTHRNASTDLKRALPLVRNVATAVASSFPLQTDKLRVPGHGIDAAFFAPADVPAVPNPTVVQVARLQAIKNQDSLLHALAHLPENVHAAVIGAVPEGEDAGYLASLRKLQQDLGLTERVQFTGGLSAERVRHHYRQAAVAVNLSPPGLFDKAALESMATGTPTIVSNPAFDDLLGDWCDLLRVDYPVEPEQLAQRIAGVIALPADAHNRMTATLRENVMAAHSLDALIPRLVKVIES
ncbi:MAG: glycosyltransferase family 4 protein [Chloroflexota bacterium]